jgi:Protein of unknown function (DUF2442)
MNPRAKKIKLLADFKIEILFSNNESKIFDCKPYFKYPVYTHLKDTLTFEMAYVAGGTVAWDDDTDIDPDRLYLESMAANKSIV